MSVANPSSVSVSIPRWKTYAELTKLRISVMVLITFATAGVLAAGPGFDVAKLLWAMLGMLGVSASGNSLNMFVERYSDRLMNRTKERPLPNQRLTATEVATFGAVSFGIGLAILFAAVNWQTAVCGIGTWFLYVFIYTPMKRKTSLNTEVGTIAGALPILMGCLATTESVPAIGWAMFAVLVLWQFPHFMAIAWMYRKDYASGNLKMLTVVDPTGKRAGKKAVSISFILLVVALLPALLFRTPVHGVLFGIAAFVLGLWYCRESIRFSKALTDASARKLLRVSVIYLPLYMLALVVACLS